MLGGRQSGGLRRVRLYGLPSVRRKAFIEPIYREFRKRFAAKVRDCRPLGERARSLELVFRADGVTPFISFVQEIARSRDQVRDVINLMYNDGSHHCLKVHTDRVVEEDWKWGDYSGG